MGQRNKSCLLREQIEIGQLPLVTSYFQADELLFLKSLALCTAGFGTRKEIPDVYLTQKEYAMDGKVIVIL